MKEIINTDEFYTNSLLFHLSNRDDPVYRRSFSFARVELGLAMILFEVDIIIGFRNVRSVIRILRGELRDTFIGIFRRKND